MLYIQRTTASTENFHFVSTKSVGGSSGMPSFLEFAGLIGLHHHQITPLPTRDVVLEHLFLSWRPWVHWQPSPKHLWSWNIVHLDVNIVTQTNKIFLLQKDNNPEFIIPHTRTSKFITLSQFWGILLLSWDVIPWTSLHTQGISQVAAALSKAVLWCYQEKPFQQRCTNSNSGWPQPQGPLFRNHYTRLESSWPGQDGFKKVIQSWLQRGAYTGW